jgi:hypothetical protein
VTIENLISPLLQALFLSSIINFAIIHARAEAARAPEMMPIKKVIFFPHNHIYFKLSLS